MKPDEAFESEEPRKMPVWIKLPLILLALLVILFFAVGNGWFVRTFVLPKVADSLGSEVQAESVSFSPFSSITLTGFKVTPPREPTLVRAGQVRVRYSLMALMSGRLDVSEVTLTSPEIHLVEHPDGHSNLDALNAAQAKASHGSSKASSSSSEPARVDIRNLAIKGAVLRKTTEHAKGPAATLEVTGFNLDIDQLKNGAPGRLTWNGQFRMADSPSDILAGKLSGSFTFGLNGDLSPATLTGSSSLELAEASGAYAAFRGLGGSIEADLASANLKALQLRFRQSGQDLGGLKLSGPFDAAKREARLKYEVSGIDRRVLGILGAAQGIGLGQTTLGAAGTLELLEGGKTVASGGRVKLSQVSLSMNNAATPAVDVDTDYIISLDLGRSTALVQKLDINGQQQGRALLKGSLDRPMNLAWGQGGKGFRDSTFTLSLLAMELAEWRALLGAAAPGGQLSATLKLQAEREGTLLRFDTGIQARNLATSVGSNRIDNASLDLSAIGALEPTKDLRIDKFSASLQRLGQPLGTLGGILQVQSAGGKLGGQFSADIQLRESLALWPVQGLQVNAGRLRFNADLSTAAGSTNVTGAVMLSEFTGKFDPYQFADYQVNAQFSGALSQDVLNLTRFTISPQAGLQKDGSVDATARYDIAKRSGVVTLKSQNLTLQPLQPFVDALMPRKVKSGGIELDSTVTLAADGEAGVKGSLRLAKWVLNPGSQGAEPAPLNASAVLDAGLKGSLVTLRNLTLALDPTARATNTLSARGQVDLATTNARPGRIEIQSPGLDLAPVYDLFNPPSQASAGTASKPAPAPAPGPEREPDAIRLPVQKLDIDVDLARVIFREIDITQWKTRVSIDSGSIKVNPWTLNMNNAPVSLSATANVGVPGMIYDLNLSADRIPLAPWNNSFDPSGKGRVGGSLIAKAQIKGAGITGPSIQKNLAGDIQFAATNLNLAITSTKTPLVRSVLNVLIALPDLVRGKPGALTDFLGQLVGASRVASGASQGGWSEELTRAPIDLMQVGTTIGNGTANLQQAMVQSSNFIARAQGRIILAPVLTNSTLDLTTQIDLRRDLAGKVGLVPSNTPTNATMVALPNFLTIGGTVGQPKTKPDYLLLARMTLQFGGNMVSETGKAAIQQGTSLIEGVGNLFKSGGRSAVTNALPAATAAPAAQPGTARTNAPAQPANPFDALRDLLPQKKKK